MFLPLEFLSRTTPVIDGPSRGSYDPAKVTVFTQKIAAPPSVFPRIWMSIPLLLAILAGAEFVVRGPIRAVHSNSQFNDLLAPYLQSQGLLRGLDPYSPATLLRLWPAEAAQLEFLPREVANGTLVARRGIPTAYPVTCLVLLTPLTLLPWPVANVLWLILSISLFAVMLRALVTIGHLSQTKFELLFMASVCALAPWHTGFAVANIAVVSTELGILAVWKERTGSAALGGILLGLSTAMKPQIGLCFLVIALVYRRWKFVEIGSSVVMGLAATALLRLAFSHTTWLPNYWINSRSLIGTGTLADFTRANATRFGLINLQVALYPLLGSSTRATITVFLISAVMFILWLTLIKNRVQIDLLDLSAITVLSLLPIYHRFYDAVFLVLPLCWAFHLLMQGRRNHAIITLTLMSPFLIPGGSVLEVLKDRSNFIPGLINDHFWESAVMAHEAWALLFLAGFLLYCMTRRTRALSYE